MPEINIDIEYFDHRKTKRLILRFGEDAAIYPIKIWSYAARHHPIDGLFSGYADEEIAAILSASSNAISILQALIDVVFLDRTPAGIAVHGWVERQGHIVAYHERAKHAANKRWSKLRQNEGNDATSIAISTPKHATSNALQEAQSVKQVEDSSEGKGVEGKNQSPGTPGANPEAAGKSPSKPGGKDFNAMAADVQRVYPAFAAKDNRPIDRGGIDTISIIAAAIKARPDHPWVEHAELVQYNPTPTDLVRWVREKSDQVSLDGLRLAKQAKEKTKASEWVPPHLRPI